MEFLTLKAGTLHHGLFSPTLPLFSESERPNMQGNDTGITSELVAFVDGENPTYESLIFVFALFTAQYEVAVSSATNSSTTVRNYFNKIVRSSRQGPQSHL